MRIHILSRNNFLYSTQRLFQAGVKAGHDMTTYDYCGLNTVYYNLRPQVYYQGDPIDKADIVIGRISPIYTDLGATVLDAYAQSGVHASPKAGPLLLARNKWRALTALATAAIPFPHSAMLSDLDQLTDIAEELGGFPLVLKLLESTHGSGVMLAPDAQSARSVLGAFASLHKGVQVQEYIAESGGADVRAIVCGDEVVAAMTRTPADHEFRSNLHRGGTPTVTQLSHSEHDLAVRATQAVGLRVAGVDFLRSHRGPLVMEVNASPGLEGIEAATGVDVAAAIIQQIVSDAKA